MQKIRLLDTKTINKIAAGEVVESPKSVVKELAENAMDAGATSVMVEIKDGGISYIRITDNGSGIPKEQVKSAFLRHATSKINQIEDLEQIFTMGFRGEALASIAAVSQVEMTTRTKDEETGTYIQIHAGEVRKIQDIACNEGTSITVQNLFYNVPARKKFLKRAATESGNVSELLQRLALGHPEISFCYINNGTTMLHTAGNNDPKTAVFYVYGKDVANQMLPLSYKKGEFAISGLIGKPELSRGNRNYENLFINGRYIKSSIVASAVEDAYKTRLMTGKFPVFVLNLEIAPSHVDVNVHPAKLEVRFKNDDEIYELFFHAVCKALESEVLIPRVEWDKKPKERRPVLEQQALDMADEKPPADTPGQAESSQQQKESVFDLSAVKHDEQVPIFSAENPTLEQVPKRIDDLLKRKSKHTPVRQEREHYIVKKVSVPAKEDVQAGFVKQEIPPEATVTEVAEKKEAFFKNYKIIGQLFRTYWVVEQDHSMYMIDQHAAHERILFEEFMNRFKEETAVSQRLLTPMMLSLDERELEVLKENKTLLEGFGFELEQFEVHTFALRSVPQLLRETDDVGFFMDILDQLSEQKIQNIYDTKLLTVATMACKAAVKGHDTLSFQEAEALIERLLKLENPFTCPHGRPTIIEMTKYELEKKFKRIQD